MPGRLSRAGESSQTANGTPGSPISSAAVVVEMTRARGRCARMPAASARRAATASTTSLTGYARRSAFVHPIRVATASTEAPASRSIVTSCASASRSPRVVPSDTSRRSVTEPRAQPDTPRPSRRRSAPR